MRFALQLCAWIIGIPLQLMVIAAMVRGAWRQYVLLFIYSIVAFLIAVAEIPSYLARYTGQADAQHALSKWYWIDDVILETLLYAVVIALIYQATERMEPRAIVRLILTGGALIFAGVSLYVHYSPTAGRGEWMTPWVRDLSFCSSVLDLALWTFLVTSKDKDPRLLLVSGGLGVQFAGNAIGDAIQDLAGKAYHAHQFSAGTVTFISRFGAIFSTITGFACLYIWWHAFRAAREESPRRALVVGATRRKS